LTAALLSRNGIEPEGIHIMVTTIRFSVATLVVVFMSVTAAHAAVLCAKQRSDGTFNSSVRIREACKSRETELDPVGLDLQGEQGAVGPPGEKGEAGAQGDQGLPGPSDTFEFVGFSTATVDGGARPSGLRAACEADFGLGARFCTSKEFYLSPVQSIPTEDTWIHVTSGFTNGASGHCNLWSVALSNTAGAAIRPDGLIDNRTCDIARPVTCCARAQ
jgi:hypothetical protein